MDDYINSMSDFNPEMGEKTGEKMREDSVHVIGGELCEQPVFSLENIRDDFAQYMHESKIEVKRYVLKK